MREPPEVAGSVELVTPGIWHWLVRNSAIGGSPSSSHLIEFSGDCVLVDPTRQADEEPDARYGDGDVLPAGLRAVRTPGPEEAHYCLLTDPAEDALICSDLLMYTDHLQFVPLRFHDDPDATRASVRGL